MDTNENKIDINDFLENFTYNAKDMQQLSFQEFYALKDYAIDAINAFILMSTIYKLDNNDWDIYEDEDFDRSIVHVLDFLGIDVTHYELLSSKIMDKIFYDVDTKIRDYDMIDNFISLIDNEIVCVKRELG